MSEWKCGYCAAVISFADGEIETECPDCESGNALPYGDELPRVVGAPEWLWKIDLYSSKWVNLLKAIELLSDSHLQPIL